MTTRSSRLPSTPATASTTASTGRGDRTERVEHARATSRARSTRPVGSRPTPRPGRGARSRTPPRPAARRPRRTRPANPSARRWLRPSHRPSSQRSTTATTTRATRPQPGGEVDEPTRRRALPSGENPFSRNCPVRRRVEEPRPVLGQQPVRRVQREERHEHRGQHVDQAALVPGRGVVGAARAADARPSAGRSRRSTCSIATIPATMLSGASTSTAQPSVLLTVDALTAAHPAACRPATASRAITSSSGHDARPQPRALGDDGAEVTQPGAQAVRAAREWWSVRRSRRTSWRARRHGGCVTHDVTRPGVVGCQREALTAAPTRSTSARIDVPFSSSRSGLASTRTRPARGRRLARREAGGGRVPLAPEGTVVGAEADDVGPHIRGGSPVTRVIRAARARASRRRTGCSTPRRTRRRRRRSDRPVRLVAIAPLSRRLSRRAPARSRAGRSRRASGGRRDASAARPPCAAPRPARVATSRRRSASRSRNAARPSASNVSHAVDRSEAGSPDVTSPKSMTARSRPSCTSRLAGCGSPCSQSAGPSQARGGGEVAPALEDAVGVGQPQAAPGARAAAPRAARCGTPRYGLTGASSAAGRCSATNTSASCVAHAERLGDRRAVGGDGVEPRDDAPRPRVGRPTASRPGRGRARRRAAAAPGRAASAARG